MKERRNEGSHKDTCEQTNEKYWNFVSIHVGEWDHVF